MYDVPAQGRLSIGLYLQQLCFTDKSCLFAKMDDEGYRKSPDFVRMESDTSCLPI